MKNRFSNRINNSIDLTSLLDVIFIVLMIVMCYQQIYLEKREANADVVMEEAMAMQDEAAEAMADASVYAEQLDTYEDMFNQIAVITVYASYQPSDPRNRQIRVLINNEEVSTIDVSPTNAEEAYGRLAQLLEDNITKHAEIPVIISLDDEQILYRDQLRISDMINGLFSKHDNLYYKVQSGDTNE